MQRVLKYDVFVTYSSKIKPILQEVESCDMCTQSNFDFLFKCTNGNIKEAQSTLG